MKTDLEELFEKFIEEHNKPTEKDRINALVKAIADLAIMIGEASDK
jgi:hypothetical protein